MVASNKYLYIQRRRDDILLHTLCPPHTQHTPSFPPLHIHIRPQLPTSSSSASHLHPSLNIPFILLQHIVNLFFILLILVTAK
ncbi:hypothetical protein SK128_003690, partial [Halocaridina rubra]